MFPSLFYGVQIRCFTFVFLLYGGSKAESSAQVRVFGRLMPPVFDLLRAGRDATDIVQGIERIVTMKTRQAKIETQNKSRVLWLFSTAATKRACTDREDKALSQDHRQKANSAPRRQARLRGEAEAGAEPPGMRRAPCAEPVKSASRRLALLRPRRATSVNCREKSGPLHGMSRASPVLRSFLKALLLLCAKAIELPRARLTQSHRTPVRPRARNR